MMTPDGTGTSGIEPFAHFDRRHSDYIRRKAYSAFTDNHLDIPIWY